VFKYHQFVSAVFLEAAVLVSSVYSRQILLSLHPGLDIGPGLERSVSNISKTIPDCLFGFLLFLTAVTIVKKSIAAYLFILLS